MSDSLTGMKLKNMLDILVDEFTLDKDNKMSIKPSIPVIEGIEKDADSCRQLIPSPY